MRPTSIRLLAQEVVRQNVYVPKRKVEYGKDWWKTSQQPPLAKAGKKSVSFSSHEIGSKTHSPFARSSLPNVWLRDNCRCSKCVNQDTMQRAFNTFELPSNIAAKSVESSQDGLKVVWDGDLHESFYPWPFLTQYLNKGLPPRIPQRHRHWPNHVTEHQSLAKISPDIEWPPKFKYGGIARSSGGVSELGQLLTAIQEYGFAFVSDVPHDSAEPTNELLELIGPVRQTHYGGFYDFIPDLAKADTAYTNLALAAHTDTTYFTEPAGLQAFHLLSHTSPDGQAISESDGKLGGRSLLVDGFHAAYVLQKEDPRAFSVLSTVKVPWHASGNEGVNIAPWGLQPVIEMNPRSSRTVGRIRWNNDDRGVVPLRSNFSAQEWYNAARKFDEILRRPELEYWFQLEPGRLLIFDNWRVLHGRSAFEGLRRICGAYINRDDFVSRLINSNYSQDEIRDWTVG